MHACMHSCIHSFMHSCFHAFMHSCSHVFILSFMHSCIHAFTHSSIHACMHAFIHSFIHHPCDAERRVAQRSASGTCTTHARARRVHATQHTVTAHLTPTHKCLFSSNTASVSTRHFVVASSLVCAYLLLRRFLMVWSCSRVCSSDELLWHVRRASGSTPWTRVRARRTSWAQCRCRSAWVLSWKRRLSSTSTSPIKFEDTVTYE